MSNLRESTKNLHHAAEQTPLGAAMAQGSISEQWWADWLSALYTIHSTIDYFLPVELRRTHELVQDLFELNVQPRPLHKPSEYILYMNIEDIEGATYVFTGAHLMGGAITAKAIGDRLPKNHLLWDDRKKVIELWSPLRDRIDLEESANKAFKAVIDICDEIEDLDHSNFEAYTPKFNK